MNKICLRPAPDDCTLPDDLHPLLRRIYAARQVRHAHELRHTLDCLHPHDGMLGMPAAVDLLYAALCTQKRLLIVADFDADGATSCALAVRALRSFGAADVRYLVPNRFTYGYGLTPEIVAVAARLTPDLLITVDNGISSVEGVQAARALGIDVLITDHHLPGAVLPAANAIVNPNLPGDTFPSKCLAGVGVMFYVLSALRRHLRRQGWFATRSEPNLAQWLDLVALGTVADVVPLDHTNRILVEQGLRRIRAGHCCAGIRALLEIGQRRQACVTAADLAFAAAPRLNAAGRLEDMSLGIEALLQDDAAQAHKSVLRLDELNRERRQIEAAMQTQALTELARLSLDGNAELPAGLCLFDAAWHPGVIGILAGRVKDQFHRPVIAFAPSFDGEIKGSARSVPGLHIRDALDCIAARHPGLITKFGGHAMAAGMSLAVSAYADFSRAFDDEVRRHLRPEDLHGVLESDGELDAADLTLETAELLHTAVPWGQGFPEPLFHGEFKLLTQRVVGDKHLKLVLQAAAAQDSIDAIAFNTDLLNDAGRVLIAYRLGVNEFQGRRSPQLIIKHIEALGKL